MFISLYNILNSYIFIYIIIRVNYNNKSKKNLEKFIIIYIIIIRNLRFQRFFIKSIIII